jgi:hypothetical protein
MTMDDQNTMPQDASVEEPKEEGAEMAAETTEAASEEPKEEGAV